MQGEPPSVSRASGGVESESVLYLGIKETRTHGSLGTTRPTELFVQVQVQVQVYV